MTDINFSEFPFISIEEFDYIEVDAIELEANMGYLAVLSFFKPATEEGPDTNQASGCIIETPIHGESLTVLFDKVGMLFESGLFDAANVSAHGTLYGTDGSEKTISWLHEGDIVVLTEDNNDPKEHKPTLH